jgi:hypothetical protein
VTIATVFSRPGIGRLPVQLVLALMKFIAA